MHEELVGKKAKWRFYTAQGLIEATDTVKAVYPCKDMFLAEMKDTGSVVNIEVLFF